LLFCRIGSTIDFTHAANQQLGMGSRKYEKATTLPTNANKKFDKDQFSTKSSLGNSVQPPLITSSPASSVVGNSFWSRTTAVGKFGGHPTSTFQDFDDSVSDAWDIKDVKGVNYGGSVGPGIVIDVQPTSFSPFSVAKNHSPGPGVHGKNTAKQIPQYSAKTTDAWISSEVTHKLEGTHIRPTKVNN
jgi:hypothetical protein